jgi:arylsulfatase A-like enzyme
MRINDNVVSPEGHATEIFTGWALDYLKKQEKSEEPFFLYLAYNAPHDPIQPPAEWLAKVKARENGITDKRAGLVALIEHLDENVGRMLKQLELSGQIRNTLIIFVSDNGGNLNFGANNGPYRGGKGDLFDGGIRIPGGMMWQNVIKPGRVTDRMMLLMDIYPTICDIAGISIQHPIDGISLLPELKGEPSSTDYRTVFFMRREGGPKYAGQIYFSARSGPYKMVQNTPVEERQFFNLDSDPFEKNPLQKNGSKEYQQLIRQLSGHIGLSGAVPWKSQAQAKKLSEEMK